MSNPANIDEKPEAVAQHVPSTMSSGVVSNDQSENGEQIPGLLACESVGRILQEGVVEAESRSCGSEIRSNILEVESRSSTTMSVEFNGAYRLIISLTVIVQCNDSYLQTLCMKIRNVLFVRYPGYRSRRVKAP